MTVTDLVARGWTKGDSLVFTVMRGALPGTRVRGGGAVTWPRHVPSVRLRFRGTDGGPGGPALGLGRLPGAQGQGPTGGPGGDRSAHRLRRARARAERCAGLSPRRGHRPGGPGSRTGLPRHASRSRQLRHRGGEVLRAVAPVRRASERTGVRPADTSPISISISTGGTTTAGSRAAPRTPVSLAGHVLIDPRTGLSFGRPSCVAPISTCGRCGSRRPLPGWTAASSPRVPSTARWPTSPSTGRWSIATVPDPSAGPRDAPASTPGSPIPSSTWTSSSIHWRSTASGAVSPV